MLENGFLSVLQLILHLCAESKYCHIDDILINKLEIFINT
jgi:hypothetical protein